MRALRGLWLAVLWILLVAITVWSVAALYIDVRTPALQMPLAILYAIGAALAVIMMRRRRAQLTLAAGFAVVLIWWFSLTPTTEGPWREDNARTASIEVNGDTVSIHNLRNCEYRSETEYSNCWHERVVHLSKLFATDFTLTTWGSDYIAHPILSFDFGSDGRVAFSLEVRYRPGQGYSAIKGFFRQSPIIFVVADERDVIRVRTNYRQGEEMSLYRTVTTPDISRKIFLTYVHYVNSLHESPEWYNALTKNCTTAVNRQIAATIPDPKPWDYQLVLNGTLDRLLYTRGRLVTGGLAFPELKAQAHINPAAKAADGDPDFSNRIRAGRVGF